MLYYLNPNKQAMSQGGNYEVHTIECHHCPDDKTRLKFLGNFNNPKDAVRAAKQHYLTLATDIDGCYFCCREENKE